MNRKVFVLALLTMLLTLAVSAVHAQVGGPDPGGECRDAAGGIIDCPQDGGSGGGGTSGQPGDRDGDGTPDERDRCPDAGGHADLGGCPDSDGDGTPDIDDACPTIGGHADNQGCPEDQTPVDPQPTPAPTAQPMGPTTLSPDNRCVVTPQGNGPVNVRQGPSLNAEIAGQLLPGQYYPTLGGVHYKNLNHTWYAITGLGWVLGEVVSLSGDCSGLQFLEMYGVYQPEAELSLCAPDYAAGMDTCASLPENANVNWSVLDRIVYCLYDEAGREDCFFLNTDEADGGIVIGAEPGGTSAPPENPIYHKFMLVGEDGLIVLTAPNDDGTTERPNADFPLYFAACHDDNDPECLFQLMMHDEDLPIAACAFNPDAIIQCAVPGNPDTAGKVQLQDFHLIYVPFDPDLPIAACAFNPDAIIQCATGSTTGQMYDPDLPLAACAFDPDAIIQCGPDFDPRAAYIKFEGIPGHTQTQTREHVLLARQVNVPTTPEEPEGDGLLFILGNGDSELALLLPAVQKVREAGA